MKTTDFLTELSNEKLAQYKTAASADASKADSEGNFKKGDKRFKGINTATKKQFDNDAKKVDEEKQRIDPKCWTGYKKQGTKMKGDTKVNNCVPKESAILEGISQVDEGWKSALGSAALAGAMALGAGAAHGRVVPGQDDPGINRLTGKPIATQVAQDDEKPAAKAPSGYSAEYLQSIIDGKITNRLISPELATQLLQKKQGQQ
jgi:hypothetical protein